MTLPAPVEQADNCQHCNRVVLWAAAPISKMYVGYTGYWYHAHNNHVLCDGPDAMEHAANRAAP